MDTTGLTKQQLRSLRLAKKLIRDASGDQEWLEEMLKRQDRNTGVVGWVRDLQGMQAQKINVVETPTMQPAVSQGVDPDLNDKLDAEPRAEVGPTVETPRVDIEKIRKEPRKQAEKELSDDFWNGKPVETPAPKSDPRVVIITVTTEAGTARIELPC